jgi:DUF971 family protein
MKKLAMFVMIAALSLLSAADISIFDDGSGTGTTTWTSDNVYFLENFVFVNPGDTLTIEPGTVIKGRYGTGAEASALIVTRGGYGIFEGTEYAPIIFTSEYDDLSAPLETRGLWGGLIVLGSGELNSTEKTAQIEGIPETEPRGNYGGGLNPNNTEDSGIYRYISIRHGGTEIGAANEINGMTFGAVGSGTTVDHIEVAYNLDDGFEWFGGTVNSSHLVAAFCGDDDFDYDVGFRGKGQFWFAIKDATNGGTSGEHDGGTSPEDGTPYAIPSIYNVTYIGSGVSSANTGNSAFNLRDNAGAHYKNGIFTDYPRTGIKVEDLVSGQDSRARFENGELTFTNCMWYGFQFNTKENICTSQTYIYPLFDETARKNLINDPQLVAIDRGTNGLLDPRPQSSVATSEYYSVTPDGFFETANYIGAFDPNASKLWTDNWTYLDKFNYTVSPPEISITDDGSGTGTTTWTNDNVYILENFVFVNPGDTLTIEPGTVIKGRYGTGAEASALIVSRGGYGIFEGTATEPIIFTSEYDDLSAPLETRGLWGGLIVLGSGELNSTEKTAQIEGIPETEPRGNYGGGLNPDNTEDSGIYRYISIRHGGTEIGAANEINGMTFGAVGSGTTVDHIEVVYNLDDGFEWFGGTVNCSHLVAAFCGDDDFDYDVGFRGKGQFWFAIKDATNGGTSGEHDGGTSPEDGTPYAIPNIYNVTYIGSGVSSANTGNSTFNFRDNAGGHYKNGIFTDFPRTGIKVEDLVSGQDSRTRFENGGLTITNSMWYGYQFNTKENICTSQTYIYPLFDEAARKNLISDPQLVAIDRGTNGLLDPRPQSSTATTEYFSVTPDGFFETANYIGAFSPSASLWTDGWTYLDQFGYTADVQGAPEAPTTVTTSVSGTDFTVYWNSVSGATSYTVYSADEPYGTYTLVTTVTGTSYTTSVSAAKKFYYVKSNN